MEPNIADGIAAPPVAPPTPPVDPGTAPEPTQAEPVFQEQEVTGQLIDNEISDQVEPMSVEDMTIPLRAKESDDQSGVNEPDSGDGSEEQEPGTTPPEPSPEPTPAATPAAEPAPQLEVPDPGEFKPGDYSFEVTIGGKTEKITNLDEANKIADNPENFSTPRELMDFLGKQSDMRDGIRQDQREWQTKKDAFDTYTESTTQREETLNNWENEINYLVEKGDLPPIAADDEYANWSDPEVAKHPGVKERLDLLQYMQSENAIRTKAGLQPFSSMVDAQRSMRLDNMETEAKQTTTKEKEVRKAKGAMVGGSTSAAPARLPKDVIVGEGGSLNDLSGYGLI